MKTWKKNNKGFSLVELIVVILIMAIIAVALAPQVMKWVDESKVSTDNNNAATLKSSIDAAVADYLSKSNAIGGEITFRVNGNLAAPVYLASGTFPDWFNGTGSPLSGGLRQFIDEVVAEKYPAFKQSSTGYFEVNITTKGAVTVNVVK